MTEQILEQPSDNRAIERSQKIHTMIVTTVYVSQKIAAALMKVMRDMVSMIFRN